MTLFWFKIITSPVTTGTAKKIGPVFLIGSL